MYYAPFQFRSVALNIRKKKGISTLFVGKIYDAQYLILVISNRHKSYLCQVIICNMLWFTGEVRKTDAIIEVRVI